MNGINQKIEIPTSKKKAILLILGCLMFVIGCIWMWTKAESQTTYSSIFLQIISIIGISFFGIGLVFGPRKLFDRKPGLIISDQGIQNNSSIFFGYFISWSNIIKFEISQVKSTKLILIIVNNPEEIIGKAGYFKQKILRYSMRENGAPYLIGSGTLKIDFDELYELLNNALGLIKK